MRRWLSCVVIVAAAAGATPEALPPTADAMGELRKIEAAWYHQGATDSLRFKYQEQARARPGDAMPRVMLAWFSLPSDDSWNQLKAIATIYPDNPWVRYGMGRIYTQWKGMSDSAQTEFDAVLKRDPKFYPALVGQGDLARSKQDYATAEAKYRAALALNDDPFAHAGLGLTYAAQQKTDQAKEELRKAIALQLEQPQALSTLLKLSLDAKDPEAVNAAQSLTELRPKDREARKLLADLRFDAGDKVTAAKEYDALVKLGNPDTAVLQRLAGLYRELNDLAGEERTLQTYATLANTDPEPNVRLAELKYARKDFEGAEAQWTEVLARDPKRVAARASIAKLRIDAGKLIEALEQYRMAVKIDPTHAESVAAVAKLEADFKLPSRKPHGNVNNVYWAVQSNLGKFYDERKVAVAGLAGKFKIRVRIKKDGSVDGLELVEDSLKDQLLVGHAWFGLRDADYAKQKGEPVFEFELGAKKKGK